MKNQLKKTVKGMNITKKLYNIIYAIPNLENANKALTEVPELIVSGPLLQLYITRSRYKQINISTDKTNYSNHSYL